MQELQDESVEQYNEQYPEDTTENILQDSASDDESESSWPNDKMRSQDDIQPTIRNLKKTESK